MTSERQRNNQYGYIYQQHQLSNPLMQAIRQKNIEALQSNDKSLNRLGGTMAFHCTADLEQKRIVEAAAMATLYRGYEALLPGKDLSKIGLVSSTASGICGGVHATASALCLEMALGLKPPPLGIVLRNLLLSCQYLNDNTMHLYVLCGPDYSADVVARTNPEIWQQAQQTPTKNQAGHGYGKISDIMVDLNKPDGNLYKQALDMIRRARAAYTLLGGKYPHSESIIPGGVSISADLETIEGYENTIQPFIAYARQTAAIWDDIFDFMLEMNPLYEQVGECEVSMLDFGQWDHEDYYDGTYENCDVWGEKRWSTPGAIIDGQLVTTKLSELNAGMEEFVDHCYYQNWVDDDQSHYQIKTDPLGNPISPHHPWNKRVLPLTRNSNGAPFQDRYSWGTSKTWRRNTFEVGAYVRMYLTAKAAKVSQSQYLHADGQALEMALPEGVNLRWQIPQVWNAFERNRARAYALGFNLAVTLENTTRAKSLILRGETSCAQPMGNIPDSRQLGVGLWGAGRGFLAHWAVVDKGCIDNYQIAIPSRVNCAPRTPWGDLGPCEKAILNTPIIETQFSGEADFSGIDVQRAIQSFDPCMTTTSHILVKGTERFIDGVIDTSFPI